MRAVRSSDEVAIEFSRRIETHAVHIAEMSPKLDRRPAFLHVPYARDASPGTGDHPLAVRIKGDTENGVWVLARRPDLFASLGIPDAGGLVLDSA